MPRPLPKNLRQFYALCGERAGKEMHGDFSFTVDGVEFVSGYAPESTADRFFIVKSKEHIALYREFLELHRPTRIFELGIAEGGSTALHALLPGIELVVAIDNEENRLDALDEFIARRGLGDVVTAHYGVDQGDRAALHEIADRDFEGEPVDLVVDDASHQFTLTRASFECLFPYLRRGGWYVIEDWSQRLVWAEGVQQAAQDELASDEPGRAGSDEKPLVGRGDPLERLAVELLVASGSRPDAVSQVSVNQYFVAVRRGPAPLDPAEFRLDHLTRSEPLVGLLAPLRDE